MSAQNDILVEIPDDQLPTLVALYQEKALWAPYISTLVYNGIKWKKSDKYKNSIIFLSPNNSWKEDGTIIILLKIFSQDIYVFTLDDQCMNLYRGLSETKRITYDNNIRSYFFAVHDKHISVVKKHIEEKNLKITVEFPAVIYALSPAEAQRFIIECPPEVYIKKLQPSNAKQINDVYLQKFLNSDKYIARFIDVNGGYGVFLKSTNQMVAWVVKHAFDTLKMLQTEINHTRKGYASLVVKVLAKETGEEGYWSVATVLPNNKGAINTFEKLGFRCFGNCTFIAIE